MQLVFFPRRKKKVLSRILWKKEKLNIHVKMFLQTEKLYFSLPFTHEKKQNISTFSRNSRKNLSHWFYTGKEKLLEFLQVLHFIWEIFCRESVFHSVSNTELFFPPGFPFSSWKDVVCNDKVKKNNNNSVKMFLEKGKKKISCVKLDASLFPRFIFLLKIHIS